MAPSGGSWPPGPGVVLEPPGPDEPGDGLGGGLAVLPAAHEHQVGHQQGDGPQADEEAGEQPRGAVGELDGHVLPHGDHHRHKAHVHPLDGHFLPVDLGSPALLVGDAEEHQLLGPGAEGGGKAGAGVLEGLAGGGCPLQAILDVPVLVEDPPVVGEMAQQPVVLGGPVVLQHDGPQHHQLPVRLGHGVVLAAGDIVVVGEAHGDVVLVLPDVIAVGVAVVGPARHGGVGHVLPGEEVAVVVVVKQPVHRGQGPQAVVGGVRPAGHVPLHADGVVELHHRAGHNAVEGLDGGDLPEHAGVVQALVKVRAALLQVGQVHVLPAV